jgi:hypothetical protein
MLGIEPRALCMLGKCFTMELHLLSTFQAVKTKASSDPGQTGFQVVFENGDIT